MMQPSMTREPLCQARRRGLGGLGAWAALAVTGIPGWALAGEGGPPRAIAVGAGVTEIAYALGAQSQLLAVDTSSLYPPEARGLPQVGYQRSLSAEGVLSLAPQVLLAGEEAGPPAVLRQIEAAGVRVVPVRGDYSVAGVLARVQAAAQALGRPREGERLAADIARQWQAVQAELAARPLRRPDGSPLKVAFLMRHGTVTMAAGSGTSADALLRLAGVDNAFGPAFSGFKPLSAEALAQAGPDAVVATRAGEPAAGDRAALLATPGLDLTPAGRQQRVAVLDIVLLLSFGPRLPQAVQALHQALQA
ncbi:MAG: ABC transporter substrate-binding protein [Comamonas sp.]